MRTSVLIVEDEPEFLQRFTEAVLADPELTVVTHLKKIHRKLAVHSRGEAVYEASQMGRL